MCFWYSVSEWGLLWLPQDCVLTAKYKIVHRYSPLVWGRGVLCSCNQGHTECCRAVLGRNYFATFAFQFVRSCGKFTGIHHASHIFSPLLAQAIRLSLERASPLCLTFKTCTISLLWRSSIAVMLNEYILTCDAKYVIIHFMTNYSYIIVFQIGPSLYFYFFIIFLSLDKNSEC